MNIIHWKLNSFININKHCYFEELFLLNVRFPFLLTITEQSLDINFLSSLSLLLLYRTPPLFSTINEITLKYTFMYKLLTLVFIYLIIFTTLLIHLA